MTDPDVLAYRIAEAERDIVALRETIAAMRRDSEDRERSRLKAGIGALGTLVLTLGTVLWSYRGVIFK